MKTRSSRYLPAAAIVALACAILWVVQSTGRDQTSPDRAANPPARKPGVRAPSRDDHAVKAAAKSPLELEIERLSLAEVYAMLPGRGEAKDLDLMIGSPEWDRASGPHWTHETLAKKVDRESVERTRLLFRRLGKLEGEAALDFLLEKYGKEQGYTGLAMTFAILGWMEADPEAAIKAFQQLNRSNTPNLPSMMWRNEMVLKRLEIVTRYSFSVTRNGESVMRIVSDQARRLIDAARLSSENRTGLLKKIDGLDEAARKADVRYF